MKLTVVALLLSTSTALADTAFTENFDRVREQHWTVSTWQAPGGEPRNHTGVFERDNVQIVDGVLQLRLEQTRDERGYYTSSGAEIVSTRNFGYGVYEFRMRSSSTAQRPTQSGEAVSGAVSAAFLYESNVNMEIDIEFESSNPTATHFLSWRNSNHRDNQHTELHLPGTEPHNQFYTYRIVWQPGMVTYYRDGAIVAQHRDVVPENPGPFMFSHWGSNSEWWGGWASPDVVRYVYVDYFTYRPFTE